ncbi:hypothetical protein ACJX0J_022620 [Zea mays]
MYKPIDQSIVFFLEFLRTILNHVPNTNFLMQGCKNCDTRSHFFLPFCTFAKVVLICVVFFYHPLDGTIIGHAYLPALDCGTLEITHKNNPRLGILDHMLLQFINTKQRLSKILKWFYLFLDMDFESFVGTKHEIF